MGKRPLSLLFGLDALLAIGFGLASGLWPVQTFGSIVQLQPLAQHTATIAALTSLSLHYALVGGVCLVGITMPPPHRWWIAALLLTRHLASGLKGYVEMGSDWQIGSPWPDLIIHSSFVVSYAALTLRERQSTLA